MDLNVKKPCNDCPYRKTAFRGWLGECSGDPKEFLLQLEGPNIHPCHKTVDWEQASDEEIEESPRCIGALQFMNNSMMQSRFPQVRAMQEQAGKNDEIMQFKHNFIKHHEVTE